jgi:hypothetical protein
LESERSSGSPAAARKRRPRRHSRPVACPLTRRHGHGGCHRRRRPPRRHRESHAFTDELRCRRLSRCLCCLASDHGTAQFGSDWSHHVRGKTTRCSAFLSSCARGVRVPGLWSEPLFLPRLASLSVGSIVTLPCYELYVACEQQAQLGAHVGMWALRVHHRSRAPSRSAVLPLLACQAICL